MEHDRQRFAGLTARQSEILALVAEGFTDREIAARLCLSPRTVEGHVAEMLQRLGVENHRAAGRAYRQWSGDNT